MSSYKKATTLQQPVSTPDNVLLQKKELMSKITKWIPLIFAGAAIGVSILALKEIKNVRKELILLKKEASSNDSPEDPLIYKKIELMDEQLKKISKYISSLENNKSNFTNQQSNTPVVNRVINKEPVIPIVHKNTEPVIKKEIVLEQPEFKVSNEQPEKELKNKEEEEYEYEEVEVTDDESEQE
jgi:hypothetical protein